MFGRKFTAQWFAVEEQEETGKKGLYMRNYCTFMTKKGKNMSIK